MSLFDAELHGWNTCKSGRQVDGQVPATEVESYYRLGNH